MVSVSGKLEAYPTWQAGSLPHVALEASTLALEAVHVAIVLSRLSSRDGLASAAS